MVNEMLLKLLVCPITKEPLTYIAEKQLLLSEKAQLAYRVKNGIPVLVAEEAIPFIALDLVNKADNDETYMHTQ